jgi:methionine sulfoxide reductase heme-binding subunit
MTWYLARAGGMLAYLLLSSSVVVGLLLSGKAHGKRWPRFALEDVHRFLGLLTGTFVVVHGGALLLDGYLPFSLGQLVIPGIAPYRPLAVSLGVVAAELLVALAVTNHYRKRLSYRFWRRAHYLNFAVWLLALVHGLTAGTDALTTWALVLYGTSAWLVLALTVHRATLRLGGPAVRPS